ncbi:Rz1-like lysis system protein LysC [Pantoea eucrina]|uniref:Rz1-like lysis system protein LysC n=1 Tax=Pantoea eucrina TaxID=472693 RepID=UPI003D35030E
MSLTSCATRQIQYEAVKEPQLPIPASLLSECPVPVIPKPMTYGDSILLNFRLLNSLDECNGKLRAISRIEEIRASQ